MTNPITDMALPDDVVEKARAAYWFLNDTRGPFQEAAWQAAIRAALQALCDCGMAQIVDEEHSVLNNKWTTRSLRIPLDADERKREETA